jgi:hypothetical protein
MIFEIDRYYAHPSGRLIHVLGELPSSIHGWCLVAEQSGGPDFISIGRGAEAAAGWQEVSKAEWTAGQRPAPPLAPELAPAGAPSHRAHAGYVAADAVELLHPADHPPEHGAKMLLYLFPWGVTVVGQWQGSGAALWAPLPKVSAEMHDRLAREFEARRIATLAHSVARGPAGS